MTNHHARSAPYESAGAIHSHFCELQKLGVNELSLLYPIECGQLVHDILRLAREFDISISALHTEYGGFLTATRGELSLARMYQPHDPLYLRWMPLKSVVFSTQLVDASSYLSLMASIDENLNSIQRLRAEYYVDFRANLALSHFDGKLSAELIEKLVNAGFSTVNLEFAFPSPSLESIDSLKQQTAEFFRHSIARHPALSFSQLPFCLVPASAFRVLYRSFYAGIQDPSKFRDQRRMIREIKNANNRYHVPCETCRRRAACYRFTRIQEHGEYAPYLIPNRESTIVFVGASLAPEDLRRLDRHEAVVTPPAQQGDGIMTVLEGFSTVLLFDGYFFQRYALTTFELLTVLTENINVFGAASLGALRGLELSNYGMRACGYVYGFLCTQSPVPYHVVAQTYSEDDRPATEALITIYRFLESATDEDIIDENTRQRCYSAAESLHFSQLTYPRFFDALNESDDIQFADVEALKKFFADRGQAAFDVKRQDALALLSSFEGRIRDDGPNYTIRTLLAARDTYLARLRSKYYDRYDSSLPQDWKRPLEGRESQKRERSLPDTIKLAQDFFSDLDVVVSDTSLLDQTHYFMINVVFVPFYFLGYGNSAGSGYGESRVEALASAYGEVLERIPGGTLRTVFADHDEVSSRKFPFQELPFYQSMEPEMLASLVGEDGQLLDRDYIECTDIITGEKYALPKHGARLPSSLGMAAGNTLLEAIVYGLYEVLEHDVSAAWLTSGLSRDLRQVNMDVACIRDPALKALISDLTERGHEVHFFNLLNQYSVPTVLSTFHEADRQLLFTGIASRLDIQDAMAHSFHEALNGHYISYFGSRDDRQGFEQRSLARPRVFLEHFLGQPKKFEVAIDDGQKSLSDQLYEVLGRLQASGIEQIFAIDLSPRAEYSLAAVKVVVPGMDRRRLVHRAPNFYRKCLETRRLVHRYVNGVDPVDDVDWSLPKLRREFSPPLQKFFKA